MKPNIGSAAVLLFFYEATKNLSGQDFEAVSQVELARWQIHGQCNNWEKVH